jgi:pimeloyl-ACP methyl ester carboxylesterase
VEAWEAPSEIEEVNMVPKGVVATGLAFVLCAYLVWPDPSYGRSPIQNSSKSRGGSHLFVLLGLHNNSPGLSEFGRKIGRYGIPTTVGNHSYRPAFAQEAIRQYKSGRLRSIMIVGHSLGGAAAVEMAAELGRAGVPVDLVVTLDPVGAAQVPINVRRSVNIRPRAGEDHFSVIAARERDLTNYVLGGRGARSSPF